MEISTSSTQASVPTCPLCGFAARAVAWLLADDREVDVMEDLVKFTLLTCDVATCLVDRYGERKGVRARSY